jgi:hypothetical protein
MAYQAGAPDDVCRFLDALACDAGRIGRAAEQAKRELREAERFYRAQGDLDVLRQLDAINLAQMLLQEQRRADVLERQLDRAQSPQPPPEARPRRATTAKRPTARTAAPTPPKPV